MQSDDPIVVDDPAILARIARLAAELSCSEEEAIGIAVSRELALLDTAEKGSSESAPA